MDSIPEICQELQRLQRYRVCHVKSRITLNNRLIAAAAVELGYLGTMSLKDKRALFREARIMVTRIKQGQMESPLKTLVSNGDMAIGAFDTEIKSIEHTMMELANKLPVAQWSRDKKRAGFGLRFLAILIGETGDLNNYHNPAKLWRRMGCAPFRNNGSNLMGATWRSGKEGRLSPNQWDTYGYSPRRRSVAYLIGDNLHKVNRSIYREHYDKVFAQTRKTRPDWVELRCHRHAMLLTTKRLFKELWAAWVKGEGL